MSDERDMTTEPMPDPALRAALVDAFGEQPSDVDWDAMRRRARSAAVFRLRARARVAPWWEQVTPWAGRLLPVGALAAAAALALAMVTPRDTSSLAVASSATTALSTADAGDVFADAVAAPNGTGSAQTVGGPVDDEWLWNATAAAHAAER